MDFVMFSTQNPPTIQQMPWPVREDDNEQQDVDYDTWLLNDLDFPWLLESDGWFVAFSISFLYVK
jgi:hypothetical protein